MALYTRAIKLKIRSVGNIRKITRAMEMVAASKMKKAVAHALASREYALVALGILADVARERVLDHPLLLPGTGDATLLVVIASNRGLCGGFNAAIARAALRFVEQEEFPARVHLITVGSHAERFARRIAAETRGSFVALSESPRIEDVGGLNRLILDEYRTGGYKKVVLAFNNFVSAITYRPVIRELLPIRLDVLRETLADIGRDAAVPVRGAKESRPVYLFEPDEEEVLGEVLPRLVEVEVYQAVLESLASEHSARMFAMKQATDNAGDMVDDLTLRYNQARQGGITQELSEIAAGASALG